MRKAIISTRTQINTYKRIINAIEVDYIDYFSKDYLLFPISNFSEYVLAFIDTIKPDLIILSGGEDINENNININKKINREIVEYNLIDYGISNNIPIIGICRGMQIINVAEGGTLHQEIPTTDISHFIEKDAWIHYHPISVKSDTKLFDIFMLYQFFEAGK